MSGGAEGLAHAGRSDRPRSPTRFILRRVGDIEVFRSEAIRDLLDGPPCTGRDIVNFSQTEIPGPLVVNPMTFGDGRGFFQELYQKERYSEAGITRPFVQDNVSRSQYGVLRGLHLQNPHAQGKLVMVMRGRVLDVAVDVRRGSPTFGRHVAVELSEENRRQLWVPRGFAHGFLVLSETADFFYKCDELYSPSDEIVVRWDDPAIGIDWPIADPTLSQRDRDAPLLADCERLPVFGEV